MLRRASGSPGISGAHCDTLDTPANCEAPICFKSVWRGNKHPNRPTIPPNADWLRQDQRLIGHTLLCLQAGLWAAARPLNLEDALIAIVGGGGDTDTNGALAGAVLGARYGASAIPQRWLAGIPHRERITGMADGLAGLDGS